MIKGTSSKPAVGLHVAGGDIRPGYSHPARLDLQLGKGCKCMAMEAVDTYNVPMRNSNWCKQPMGDANNG